MEIERDKKDEEKKKTELMTFGQRYLEMVPPIIITSSLEKKCRCLTKVQQRSVWHLSRFYNLLR